MSPAHVDAVVVAIAELRAKMQMPEQGIAERTPEQVASTAVRLGWSLLPRHPGLVRGIYAGAVEQLQRRRRLAVKTGGGGACTRSATEEIDFALRALSEHNETISPLTNGVASAAVDRAASSSASKLPSSLRLSSRSQVTDGDLRGGEGKSEPLGLRVTSGRGKRTDHTTAMRIGYVTDCEGDLDYFRRYVNLSKVLEYDVEEHGIACRQRRWEEGRRREQGTRADVEYVAEAAAVAAAAVAGGSLRLVDETTDFFVYGGDLFDKGNGDLRLCAQLVALKKRYPRRVFLLIGNRDINKLRFGAELDAGEVGDSGPGAGAAFTPPVPPGQRPPRLIDHLENHKLKDTRVERVKWMLGQTMGAAGTFENRRTELADIRSATGSDGDTHSGAVVSNEVTDEEVAASFYDSVATEDGAVMQYLRHAQMGVCIGNTVFVHGAIGPCTQVQHAGTVPTSAFTYERHTFPGLDGGGDSAELLSVERQFNKAVEKAVEGAVGGGAVGAGAAGGEEAEVHPIVCSLPEEHMPHEWVGAMNDLAQRELDAFIKNPRFVRHNAIDRNQTRHTHGNGGDSGEEKVASVQTKSDGGNRGALAATATAGAAKGNVLLPLTGHRERAGQALLSYQSEYSICGRSLVVSTYFKDGRLIPPMANVASYLQRGGLARVVVGHKPVGDCPLVVSSRELEMEVRE